MKWQLHAGFLQRFYRAGRYAFLLYYMTIIGLYRCASDQPLQYKYVLEVVSWGQVYYIDYDMYVKNLNYFSNILSVY